MPMLTCVKCQQPSESAMARSTPKGKPFWDRFLVHGEWQELLAPVLCDDCCASYPWRASMRKPKE